MQDTTHKRAKAAVPRLVVVLVFCLYVAMVVPSTMAALITVTRFEVFHVGVFRPNEVTVTPKDQLEFSGIGEDPFRIEFSESCKDDLIDGGVDVTEGEIIQISSLFSKTSSKTAFAAFEKTGCQPGNSVKITLQGHVTPAPKPSGATNSTASSTHANNSTTPASSSSDNEAHRKANATTSHADENSRKASSSPPTREIVHANKNEHKESLTPTMAAIIGSAVTFGFASVFAIGFLIYRRRHNRVTSGATNDRDGKHLDDEPLTAKVPDSPDNKEPNPYYPTMVSNAEASPSNPYYPMMISNAEAPSNAYYPMMISNVEAPRSPYPTVISNVEALPGAYPAVMSNVGAYRAVASNAEAPPVYDAVVPMFVSYHEPGGSDTNHEVITDTNFEVAAHTMTDT